MATTITTTTTQSKIQPLKELNIQTPPHSSSESPPVTDPISDTEIAEKCVCNDKNGTAGISKCRALAGVATPDRIHVPKPFKYPERYTSPTDHMMSPISKGLLARGRRGGALLPPSKTRSKINELQAPHVDVGKIQSVQFQI